MADVEFTDGVDFDFGESSITSLGPGEYVLIVRDLAAFSSRYDTTGMHIAGEFANGTGLSNGGEQIVVELNGSPLFDFTYDDSTGWPQTADGDGNSLVPVNPSGTDNLSAAASWRASHAVHGSPGEADIPLVVPSLRITEVHYNPAAPIAGSLYDDADEFEFVELQNVGASPIDLQGIEFTDGITFTFGSVNLAPNEYIVVVNNLAAFVERYGPGINVAGEYSGQLSNGGEGITLTAANTAIIENFDYDDDTLAGWPNLADGGGHSLVIVDQFGASNPNLAASWRNSFELHGSPGRDDIDLTQSLTLSLAASSVLENAGSAATQLTIARSGPTTAAVQVTLQSNDTSEATLQLTATIPAGEASINVPVDAIDDLILDGDQTVLLSAFAAGYLADNEVLLVQDNDSNGSLVQAGLRVSEVHYNPSDPTAAEIGAGFTDADDFEFLELTNISGSTLDLTGVAFTDGISFTFGPYNLPAGGYAVLVEDQAAFQARYGTSIPIAGVWSGGLSNSGEQLVLVDGSAAPVQDFTYADGGDFPGRPDGKGSSLEIEDPSADYNDGANWRPSSEYDGSPGAAGAGPDGRILVNEVLAHTDLPAKDAIELFNTTGIAIDVGGWYLSDSSDNYKKYRIPDGTTITPGGYLSFDEDNFNVGANAFGLSGAHGDDVWLLEANEGDKLLRFVEHVEFGGTFNGVSLGRWSNGSGELFPMTSVTMGAENSGPRVFDVVISEVHYNSAEAGGLDDLEFVEIFNQTGTAIDLTDWRIRKGIDFDFDPGTMLPAYGALPILSFDPNDAANAARTAAFPRCPRHRRRRCARGWLRRKTRQRRREHPASDARYTAGR